VTANSNDLSWDWIKEQASSPQYKHGKHFIFNNSTTTFSEATRPTFPKTQLSARKNDFLALDNEQQNLLHYITLKVI